MFHKRHKIPRRYSERSFSRGAKRVHPRNVPNSGPMRGGIRL